MLKMYIHPTISAAFRRAAIAIGAMLAFTAPALSQTTALPVLDANKTAWSENSGWLNWRDAGDPTGSEGAKLFPTYFSGRIWAENIGWISLGNGNPSGRGGLDYLNVDGVTAGVNRDEDTNELNGLAWSENAGWINFAGGAMATPPNPARYDPVSGRLRGFAWGENIGWINLDDAVHFVAFQCTGDFNGSGSFSVQDIFDFLAAYFAGDPQADINASGSLTVQDIFDFLASYFLGCA